jgi:cytochrome c-type biogenesis protein CcmH/NrfG
MAAVVPAAVFVLAACLIVVWQSRRFPFLVMGWFWFLGTLIPVIGLVQVGPQAMADRYAYVPLIGIFIIISWGATGVFAHWRFPKAVITIAAGLILTACAFRTRDQLGCWQNDGTLFRHAIAVTPNYFKGYLTLGNYFEQQGFLNEAMDNYRSAIRIDPNNLATHVKLGTVLEKTGRTEEAVGEFREATRIDPQSPEIRYDLGCELYRLGRRDEAIEQFTEALRLKPDFALALQSLHELGVSPPY